jgi:hypothetical protein
MISAVLLIPKEETNKFFNHYRWYQKEKNISKMKGMGAILNVFLSRFKKFEKDNIDSILVLAIVKIYTKFQINRNLEKFWRPF